MIITAIEKQKHNDKRYNVFIDNNFCFSADKEDIIKYSIEEGMEISQYKVEEIIELCETSKAYNYALNLISIRDYSSKEITDKLKLKNYSLKAINIVLEKLNYYGFINDFEYTKKYIKYYSDVKKYSKKKITTKLYEKGIKLSNHSGLEFDESLEYENLKELAIKKFKLIQNKDNKKQRLYRYLISKGYENDMIIKVIKEIEEGI